MFVHSQRWILCHKVGIVLQGHSYIRISFWPFTNLLISSRQIIVIFFLRLELVKFTFIVRIKCKTYKGNMHKLVRTLGHCWPITETGSLPQNEEMHQQCFVPQEALIFNFWTLFSFLPLRKSCLVEMQSKTAWLERIATFIRSLLSSKLEYVNS